MSGEMLENQAVSNMVELISNVEELPVPHIDDMVDKLLMLPMVQVQGVK